MPPGELNTAIQGTGTSSTADGDDLFYAAVSGTRDHRLAVGVELLHLEMRVGIYEHRISDLGRRTSAFVRQTWKWEDQGV